MLSADLIGNYDDGQTEAILRWMETFRLNEQFIDMNSGRLTVKTISDGLPMAMILQDA